jgi:crotonobetainyl-CoA:carnitine CoA-transferase CaiB-like acyl-CoA transferase
MDEVFADPQVRHLGMAAPIEHPSLGKTEIVNQPIKLSRTPNIMQRPTPDAGEHTDEVLRELGYDAATIADLRARKVV